MAFMHQIIMPVKLINHIDDHTILGLWEITESLEWLQSNVKLSKLELEHFQHFKVEERKNQWLAYRHLLREMAKGEHLRIEYDKIGKPLITDSHLHISVSHSGRYAAAIIHKQKPVGIDIERVSTRILKVEDRFLSDMERASLDPDQKLDKLCIYWCAKEALYKMHGQKAIDFKEHLLIDHFPVHHQGELKGKIQKEDFKQSYQLQFMRIDDYYMVYVMGDE